MKFRHLQDGFELDHFNLEDFVTIKSYKNKNISEIVNKILIEKFTIEIKKIENEIRIFEKKIPPLFMEKFSIQNKTRFSLNLMKLFNRTHLFSLENVEQKHSGNFRITFPNLFELFKIFRN